MTRPETLSHPCGPRATDDTRGDKAKLAAWASLLRLLALYALGSPDVVDAELASDLVVITASAFEGAEAQAQGESPVATCCSHLWRMLDQDNQNI